MEQTLPTNPSSFFNVICFIKSLEFQVNRFMEDFREWVALNEVRYGQYCGPGPKLNKDCTALANGQPLPAPINTIDSICQKHDIKYCKCGSHWTHGLLGNSGSSCSRGADKDIQKDLMSVINKLSGSEKLVGNLILRYFQHHERSQRQFDRSRPSGPQPN